LAAGNSAANHHPACTVLALKHPTDVSRRRAGTAVIEAQMEELFDLVDQDNLEQVRQFVDAHDLVELPDEYYYMVEAFWPELLHKVKPPRELMH
jgi:hypothetical protein